MREHKTLIETMDENMFVFGDRFYNVIQCEHGTDPCHLCEVGKCPFRACVFARFGRYLKEAESVSSDLRMLAERAGRESPQASFLMIEKDIIVKENNMKTNKNTTFKAIVDRIVVLQAKKNESYGNAFERSCDKYGIISALTRLNDKMNRLDSLYKSDNDQVFGESFIDTLTDLAAYAIMTIEWIENGQSSRMESADTGGQASAE